MLKLFLLKFLGTSLAFCFDKALDFLLKDLFCRTVAGKKSHSCFVGILSLYLKVNLVSQTIIQLASFKEWAAKN